MTPKLTAIKSLIEEISMGPFGSDIKVENFIDSGVPVLNGSNLSGVKLNEDDFKYVSEEKAISLKKANARAGDIVITHRGTLGQISYIPNDSRFDKYVISQSQFRVRFDSNKVDPVFITYYFHTNEGQKRLLANKSYVGVPALAQATTNFRRIEIPLPNLTSQQKIAKVLSALDAKIELNNRINAELEAMAKLLYDYWFVQFDFPMTAAQAAALGKPHLKGQPYKSSGGKMVFNPILKRVIPEGWEAGTLRDIAHIVMGQSPPGESYNLGGEGCLFFQGSTDFGWRFPTARQFTTQPTRFAKEGDILLSVRAPVGTMNIAPSYCAIGRGLSALRSKTEHDTYLWSVMSYFKQIFDRRNADGTTFGSINKDDLHALMVVMPEAVIVESFEGKVRAGNKMIATNQKQNQELTTLRDWLLPMLMNGQISL